MNYVLTFLNWIFIAFLVLAMFNILIVVHELGHFLAARWRGLVVEKFAIWFGKPIWKKKIGDVEYLLGSIPAGGYVALPQMAPMETVEGSTNHVRENLPEAKPLDKIIVAFAGPLFSFGLALVFACIVWVVGKPVYEAESSRVIGLVAPDSGAEAAGLQLGDEILEVDGKEVRKFFGMGPSVQWQVIRSEGDNVPFTILRDGQVMTIPVTPQVTETELWERGGLRQAGVMPGMQEMRVDKVFPNGPAERAGLKPGDIIAQFNGERLWSTFQLGYFMKDNPGKEVLLTVIRDGQTLTIPVMPEVPVSPPDAEVPMLGIVWDPGLQLVYPDPWQQVVDSVTAIGETLYALFSPRSNVNVSHLSGPVGIMNLYGRLFQSPEGWRLVLWLSVLINVNLAIFNLLPIPVLDGGHITLAILEMIRRRTLSMRILEPVQAGFAILLLSFMAYVSFYDIQDFYRSLTTKAPKIEFASDSSAPDSAP